MRWILCLVAVIGLASPSDSAAAPKVDLTDYLDGHAQVGDFWNISRSDGESVHEDLIDLLEHKKSTEFLYQITEAGEEHREIEEIVHGKERRLGSTFYPSGLAFYVPHPKRIQSFRVTSGRAQKYKVNMKVYLDTDKVGTATLNRASTFLGFESVDTPVFGTLEQTAHFHREQRFVVRINGSIFISVSMADSWIDKTYGTVKLDYESHTFQDGISVDSLGPVTYFLENGKYQGDLFP